jgi:hypothetical protein
MVRAFTVRAVHPPITPESCSPMKTILRSMLTLGVIAFSRCDDPTGSVRQLGNPELVSFQYACDTWTPRIDASTVVLADLYLGHGTSASELAAAVRKGGGRIMHQYNVEILRAVVRAGDIPGLPIWSARGVTDPETTELQVLVGYSRTPTEADAQALRAIGGRDTSVLEHARVIIVTVSDAAIPRIELLSGVTYVDRNAPACVS